MRKGSRGMSKSLLKSVPGRSRLRPLKRAVMRPSIVRPLRRRTWERKWRTRDEFAWKAEDVPVELAEAVESGWLVKGMSVLDLGCGDGDNAAWMAGQGFRVHAIDFSETAIKKARDTHQGVDGLTFETVDVSIDGALSGQTFDALVDRGCLHGIPEQLRPMYVRNVTAWARPGAPLLLTMVGGTRRQLVERLLGDSFQIEGLYPLKGLVRTGEKEIDAVAIRLRRVDS
jgi:2-polyprenyl-3-methyl-5-hydroxy-6-metoxy-1,4-benzoquinol methylase